MEFLGKRDSHGLKQGFGIQINLSGDKFKAIFTNDQVSGWGIFEHKDGDIFIMDIGTVICKLV